MIRYALVLVFSLVFSQTAFAQERMGPIPAEKMTDSQKKAAADHTAARGSLTGPWSVLVRSPELMGRVRGLSDYVRFNSALPPRLSEFVIHRAAVVSGVRVGRALSARGQGWPQSGDRQGDRRRPPAARHGGG